MTKPTKWRILTWTHLSVFISNKFFHFKFLVVLEDCVKSILNLDVKKMKNVRLKTIALLFSMLFLFSVNSIGADCGAGGPGASGCQFKSVVSVFGIALWSV